MKLVWNFGVFGDAVQPTETWKGRNLLKQNFCLEKEVQLSATGKEHGPQISSAGHRAF